MEAPIGKNYDRSLKKSINRTFSSTPCENLAPINYRNGILQTPILYHSYPPILAHQKQPPLLPLPISKSSVNQHYNNNNHVNTLSQNRAFSLPPTNRKFNKSKNSSSKPKSSKVVPQITISDKIRTIQRKSSEVVIGSSTNPLSPDPKDLPKDVSKVLAISSLIGVKEQSTVPQSSDYAQKPVKVQSVTDARNSIKNDVNSFVVFNTISPPPSSLPLPTFSLRPKLSCNAEASAGVDTGATDNLRRLLRLR